MYTESITPAEQVRQLLSKPYKLVLVQRDELMRIRFKRRAKPNEIVYIQQLYDHYILLGLGKTYLS